MICFNKFLVCATDFPGRRLLTKNSHIPVSWGRTATKDKKENVPFRGQAERNDKKTVRPSLSEFTEAETLQVTPSKLPHGTRKNPLSAAAFLP